MKQWKKGMAVILAFALVIVGLNISPKSVRAEDTPRFFAEDITAEPGSEIEIPIKISGNTGIMGLGITFGFDKQVLTPVDDVKQTSLLVGQFNDSIGVMKDDADTFKVLWQGTDNMYEDGELFTLKFRVADDASGSTAVTLTTIEDETYMGVGYDMENVAVNCENVTVMIKKEEPVQTSEPTEEPKQTEEPKPTEEPKQTPEPTEESKPTEEPKQTAEPTEEPYDPTWTDAPEEVTADVYLDYYSDEDHTEQIDGLYDKVYAHIIGNGEYFIEFKATQSTEDIYCLKLSTWLDKEDLPNGMRIVPTTLTVGNETYPLLQYKEDNDFGYMVIIRDRIEEFDGGYAQIPVSAGDVVKVIFKVEGISAGPGDDPVSSPSVTEQPPVSTDTPEGQNPGTVDQGTANAPGTVQNQPGNTTATTGTKTFSLLKKITLQSVKAAGKKKLKVKWKWDVYRKDGYQIQYAQNRSFTKKKRTVNVNWTRENKTLTKLASKKTYYVRVRAYEYYNGRKYYGPWSNIKKCKVK